MNCKNLRIRTKKGIKYKYCILLKKVIKDECYNCMNKEYKIYSKQKKKHKLTKKTEIPIKVKKVVWERDHHQCIYCNKYVDVYYANSHYIKRSQLGLGIEQNVVAACPDCHYKYDFKDFNNEMKNYTKQYLSSLYDGWNEENLVYKKS